MADSQIKDLASAIREQNQMLSKQIEDNTTVQEQGNAEQKSSNDKDRNIMQDRFLPALKKIGDIPKGFAKAISNLPNALYKKSGVEGAVDGIGAALKTLLAGLVTTVGIKSFLEGWEKADQFFGENSDISEKIASGLAGIIQSVFQLNDDQTAVVARAINDFFEIIETTFANFKLLATGIVNNLTPEEMKTIGNAITSVFRFVGESMGKAFKVIANLITGNYKTAFNTAFGEEGDLVQTLAGLLAIGALFVPGKILKAAGFAVTTFAAAGSKILKPLIGFIAGLLAFTRGFTMSAIGLGSGAALAAGGAAAKYKGANPNVKFDEKSGRYRNVKDGKFTSFADATGGMSKKYEKLFKFLRFPGIAALLAGYDIFSILNSNVSERQKTKLLGGVLGGVLGSGGGAAMGAAVGAFGGPPGIALGGLLGGGLGYFAGDYLGQQLAEFLMGAPTTTAAPQNLGIPDTSSFDESFSPTPRAAPAPVPDNTAAAVASAVAATGGNVGYGPRVVNTAVAGDTNNIGISLSTGVKANGIEILSLLDG